MKIINDHLTNELHPIMSLLVHEVNKFVPLQVCVTSRSAEFQHKVFAEGKSKLDWPESPHNTDMKTIRPYGAEAVDMVPLVNDKPSFNQFHVIFFAGMVMACALRLGIPLRWGGNWDRDSEVITDQTFQDLMHFELDHIRKVMCIGCGNRTFVGTNGKCPLCDVALNTETQGEKA